RLRRNARAEDLVARYGGEEFAVAMPETDLAGAALAGERFRRVIADEPFATDAGSIAVTVSVGAAARTVADSRSANELLQMADEHLYEAKRSGRNRVIPAPPTEVFQLSVSDATPAPAGTTREYQL